jgi:cytochrome c-type biogenesis protein
MMLALEGQYSLNFLRGVLATVNPCGFVLLPTYLMYFLGTEGARPGTQRASLQRALVVSASVTAGFFAVFLVIGIAVQSGVSWLTEHFDVFGLVVGFGLVVLGVAMLFGFKLSAFTPKLASRGDKDRTVVAMFVYGVSYAVASLGCTLGLFLPALASASRNGYASAVVATAMYGLGMGLTLTALTVALASARTGLLRVMRRAMVHLDLVAGVLMVLTGLYLMWYWGTEVRESGSDKGAAVDQVESWQTDVATWLNNVGVWPLALVFGGVTVAAVVFVLSRRNRPAAPVESAEE